MQGKQGGNETAPPEGAGHLIEDEKQQEAVRQVQNQIGQMVHARPYTVELAVQHVRKPRQWMPIWTVSKTEGPDDTGCGQSGTDMVIFGKVNIVIQAYKVMPYNLPIDCKSYGKE